MRTWIFQANPKHYNVNGRFAEDPVQVTWSVARYANDMQIGDTVYIWRALGRGDTGPAAIIARCEISSKVQKIAEPIEERPFLFDGNADSQIDRVHLAVKEIANLDINHIGGLVRERLKNHPKLHHIGPLNFGAGTNYRVEKDLASDLNELWDKVDRRQIVS